MLLARFALLTLAATATAALAQNTDPFAENVRTTEPLTPAVERTKFHLPPGFEIQLVAAEPELRKPMNMAFDATGSPNRVSIRFPSSRASHRATASASSPISDRMDARGRWRSANRRQ